MNYVDYLSNDGDPTEKLGVKEYDLGKKFPRYAEFWWRFVVPNRASEQEKNKLRDDLNVRIEEIFNTHYSIFYQLTHAYALLAFLSNDEESGIIEVASPLYHLATALDLIEALFVSVLRLNQLELIKKLSKKEFDERAADFWTDYPTSFNKLSDNLVSVTFSVQRVTDLFNIALSSNPNGKKAYNEVQQPIRRYRNKFIHGVSPLRLRIENKTCFPRIDYLNTYKSGHWSSGRNETNPQHYEPAVELMYRLADKLVNSANELWELLIKEIAPHIPMPENYIKFQELAKSVPYQNITSISASGIAGTLTPYAPPTNPSGTNYTGSNSDGDPLS